MSKQSYNADMGKLYSYQASILHARAYRNLKLIKNDILKRHNLTMMQWMVVGLINDAGDEGIRISDIAEQLDTTQAFATTTVNILEARQFVVRSKHATDKRAKLVKIAPDHRNLIETIESDVRQKLRESLYVHISREELASFIKVLSVFADDAKNR